MSLLQLKLTPNAFTPSSHRFRPNRRTLFTTTKIRAVSTVPDKNSDTTESNNEPPSIGFAFVNVSSIYLFSVSKSLAAKLTHTKC
jgi:hypothetical protein